MKLFDESNFATEVECMSTLFQEFDDKTDMYLNSYRFTEETKAKKKAEDKSFDDE